MPKNNRSGLTKYNVSLSMEFSTGAVERNKCGFVNPFREMDYSHRDAAYRARRLQNRTPPGGNLAALAGTGRCERRNL